MSIMIPAWVNGTLKPVEKLEAHVKGLRHKAVSVFVTKGDQVLMQQRAMCKYHTPGLWTNTCCTHPGWHETPAACARRRLWEELGIENLDCQFRHHLEYRAAVGGGLTEHEVVDVFVAEAPDTLRVIPNPEEVMAVKWMRFGDIRKAIEAKPKEFTPWLRIYVHDHAADIFGLLEKHA